MSSSGANANSVGDHRNPNFIGEYRGNLTLEQELDEATQIELHKKNVNDAKLRAVHDKVATYEQFHELVLGADLKPLERKDRGRLTLLEGLTPEQQKQWKDRQLSGSISAGSRKSEGSLAIKPLPKKAPETAMQFTQEWARCCASDEDRLAYLQLMPPSADNWAAVFTVGIDTALLTHAVRIFEGAWPMGGAPADVCRQSLSALVGLGRTPRFDLALDLLSPAEVELFTKLCGAIAADTDASGDDQAVFAELKERYARFLPAEAPDMSAFE